MDLLQLQYFIAIAEYQHITKAAAHLHVSQPSLSNTLSRIENELGTQLFDRQGRNIVLNDSGKIVAFISRIARPQYMALCTKYSRLVYLTNDCARYNVHLIWDPRRTLTQAETTLLDFVQHQTHQFSSQCENNTFYEDEASLLPL